MNTYPSLFFVIVLFFASSSLAQKWDVQLGAAFQPKFTAQPQNVWAGLQINGSYHIFLTERYAAITRLEFQGNAWGNHLLPGVGFQYLLSNRKRWSLHGESLTHLGAGFYSPRPLLTGKSQNLFFLNYKTIKGHEWGIGIGLQYVFTPKYMLFSETFQSLNIPLVVRWGKGWG